MAFDFGRATMAWPAEVSEIRCDPQRGSFELFAKWISRMSMPEPILPPSTLEEIEEALARSSIAN
jgi:hypothetical protein